MGNPSTEIEQFVNAAINVAYQHRQPVELTGEGSVLVLIQPVSGHLLLMLGVAGERRIHPEAVLRRRATQPDRYGAWLPATLHDGTLVLSRRLALSEASAPTVGRDELSAALELVA